MAANNNMFMTQIATGHENTSGAQAIYELDPRHSRYSDDSSSFAITREDMRCFVDEVKGSFTPGLGGHILLNGNHESSIHPEALHYLFEQITTGELPITYLQIAYFTSIDLSQCETLPVQIQKFSLMVCSTDANDCTAEETIRLL